MTSNIVLESAFKVASKARDVKINQDGVNQAARSLFATLQATPYTTSDWAQVPLHPTPSLHPPEELIHWVFLVSTLNFSFWSDLPTPSRFGIRWKLGVEGKGGSDKEGDMKVWTGYWSLLAALHRAREEGVDIVNPRLWKEAPDSEIKRWFKSDQDEEMPLMNDRVRVIREAGTVLHDHFGGSFENVIKQANGSALALVDLVTTHFPCYDDRTTYDGDSVFIRKRAQILVAETWAAFDGAGPGRFHDIDQLTMFADYRVPQILHSLSTITYSDHLVSLLKSHTPLPNGSREEVEIRALSIVAVEQVRRAIAKLASSDTGGGGVEVPNAVLLDFLLWDLAKVEESRGKELLPHHRTRSIYY
ncbi:hypothetical protein T439DRAFT_134946 [Meredithblackwellia eburnea MCA 4105]